MQQQSPVQLNMSIEGGNPFASYLRDGKFVILLEYNVPLQEQPFESAVEAGIRLAKRTRNCAEICGLAVTDRLRGEHTHDPVETAAALMSASHKPILMHISGKGSSLQRAKDLLARAESSGIYNLLAITGDRSGKNGDSGNRSKPPVHATQYLDSVDILRMARRNGRRTLAGAAVNPFKYTPADQYLQYVKAVRKLASGADFLVTQAGWDMKKMQELQWYLQMREIDNPVIARLHLLNVNDIQRIHTNIYAGVEVAKPFAAMLQRESNINATQSLAAQLHRLALQVCGCRILGYSGVQLAGIPDENTLDMVLVKIREIRERYQSYAEWVAAWNEFHNGIDFSPRPNAYYGFSNLLSPDCQMYAADLCKMSDCTWPLPTLSDKCISWVIAKIAAENSPSVLRQLLEVVYCRNRRQPLCTLRYCYYLCSAACPKNLVYGACGGTYADGTCEFGHKPCFFHRVIALGAARHQLDKMEEGIPND